jgi:alkaline phosphatase
MPFYKFSLFVLLGSLLTTCRVSDSPASASSPGGAARPENVVLMIGDGMGLSYISAAMYASKDPLAMLRFPVVGFHKTYASDDLITDSASGATAFSCGVKTYRFAIGMDKDSLPCKTLLEEAEERGLATGLIATATIVHATPAAFIAHQKNRVMYEEIAADFLNTEVDLIIGGGKRYFDNRESDNRNLIEEWRKKDYHISDYKTEPLKGLVPDPSSNFVYFTGDKHPVSASLGRDYLPYSSRLAMPFLDNRSRKGFFLVIEGSQIDWAGHSNDSDWAIAEMLDFDRAVGEVFNWARRRGNTLVIVTADHETGGLAVDKGSTFEQQRYSFTTNMHTGTMVPVLAYGPGAELFSGIYENTAIYDRIRLAMGFTETSLTPGSNVVASDKAPQK